MCLKHLVADLIVFYFSFIGKLVFYKFENVIKNNFLEDNESTYGIETLRVLGMTFKIKQCLLELSVRQ